MWKRALLALALSLAAPAEKLRLGAWNIEWLDYPQNRTGLASNRAQKPEDLANYIEASGVDLLALEEICVDSSGSSPTLNRALQLLSESQGQTWKVLLFPKKDGASTQLTGVAWNTARAELVGQPIPLRADDLSADGYNLLDRAPQAVKFRFAEGRSDFVLIPLHLKSNRKVNGRAIGADQRAQESAAILQVLPDIRKTTRDKDLVLLGDFNVKEAREKAVRQFVAAGFRDLNANDRSTFWKGQAPFDRFFVPQNQPEFRHSRLTLFKPERMSPEQFKIRLSDHYMVTTDMEIGADDD
jgi:endonuclease/exonuclease/phosphatase family metal-dependent hydrolase